MPGSRKNNLLRLATVVFLLLLLSAMALPAGLTRADLESKLVTLSVDKGEAVDILKLLAAQNEFNLSVSSAVGGSVTVSLADVSVADALDVITTAVAASWYIAGNIVVVKEEGRIDRRELEIKLFRLQHIPAKEAQKILTPLVPEGGKVEILSRQSGKESSGWDEIIQIVTFPAVMEQVEQTIEQIDQPRPLVEIEVKIIETDVRDDKTLGINFPDNISIGAGNLQDESGVTGLGTHPLKGGKWTWGHMTVQEVSFLVDFLVRNGRSKLVSNPRITTLSNQQAIIEVTTTIPVQTLNRFSEAGITQDIVSFQDLDVSIKLLVTPRVTADSTIILDISCSVEEITGYTGPVDNQRPITARRSVSSSVTVKAGETLGLGGLMKEVEHKTTKKLPLLGSIPLIGRLFQHRKTTLEKTDLLILITPRIVSAP